MHACITPSLSLSTPGEGEVGRRGEGVPSGGGVYRLCYWMTTLLLPPPPPLEGGLQRAEEVPGYNPSLLEERSACHGG